MHSYKTDNFRRCFKLQSLFANHLKPSAVLATKPIEAQFRKDSIGYTLMPTFTIYLAAFGWF